MSGATPYPNRVGNPRSKSDIVTPTSLSNYGNTHDPTTIAISLSQHP